MKQTDNLAKVIYCCEKRSDVLINKLSMSKYNYYYDKMRVYAKKLFEEKRNMELLPYLNDENLSVQFDIACLLYNSYEDLCKNKLLDISEMTCQTGLPKHFIMLNVAADANLKYGIPKDYP
ncbi:MAG: hypothetical protein FWG90_01100 [Oscillospiraceae bacterium]|nr:hypothetical protein [Oscillospiraceae bacterium]